MSCARARTLLFSIVVALAVFLPSGLRAEPTIDCIARPNDPACQGMITVTASVISNISPALSRVTTDLIELPADGVSSVIVTVAAINNDGSIAADREIAIISNRGNVDLYGVFVGNNLESGNKGKTNSEGIIRFTVRSHLPGQTTLTIQAENIFLNDRPTVTFTPLPIINNIIITVPLPTLPGQPPRRIIIFQPPPPKPVTPVPIPEPKVTDPAEDKLVNRQIEINVPFWIFLLIGFLLMAIPLIIFWVILMIRRVNYLIGVEKASKEKEEALLNQIFLLEQQQLQSQQYEIEQNAIISQQIERSNSEIKKVIEEEIKNHDSDQGR